MSYQLFFVGRKISNTRRIFWRCELRVHGYCCLFIYFYCVKRIIITNQQTKKFRPFAPNALASFWSLIIERCWILYKIRCKLKKGKTPIAELTNCVGVEIHNVLLISRYSSKKLLDQSINPQYDFSSYLIFPKIWVCVVANVAHCFEFFGLFWLKSMPNNPSRMHCDECSQYIIEFTYFNHKPWQQSNKSLQ